MMLIRELLFISKECCRECKNKNCHICKPTPGHTFIRFSMFSRRAQRNAFRKEDYRESDTVTRKNGIYSSNFLPLLNTHLMKTYNQENISLSVLENRDLDLLFLRLYPTATTGQQKRQTVSNIAILLKQTENHITNQIHRA